MMKILYVVGNFGMQLILLWAGVVFTVGALATKSENGSEFMALGIVCLAGFILFNKPPLYNSRYEEMRAEHREHVEKVKNSFR